MSARPRSPAWAPTAGLGLVMLAAGACSGIGASGTEATTTHTTTRAERTTTTSRPAAINTAPPPGSPVTSPPSPGPSGDPTASPPGDAVIVTIASISDGDTLDARLPNGKVDSVRLIGINAPEAQECFAAQAAAALAMLVPPTSQAGLTSDTSERDQFGRLLRYLWVGSMSVNEEMVRRGAAISRRYPPDVAMSDRIESAQADAKEAAAGLWARRACGEAASAEISIVELLHDPPGNDNEALNDEWIRIHNDGDRVVELTGWTIKDESSAHRYSFPVSFALAPGETATIHSGCGNDFSTDLYWCNRGSAIWNNDGDTAFLLDPSGNIHDTYGY